jgi:hypothetical protein
VLVTIEAIVAYWSLPFSRTIGLARDRRDQEDRAANAGRLREGLLVAGPGAPRQVSLVKDSWRIGWANAWRQGYTLLWSQPRKNGE